MNQRKEKNRKVTDYISAMEQRPFQKRVCAKNQTSSRTLTRLKFVLFAALCLFYAHASYAKDIETLYPSDITTTSAVCGGKMSANSSVGQILQRGICYVEKGSGSNKYGKTTLNTNNSKIVCEGTSEQEFAKLKMTGLKKNTTYQVRAYIIGTDGSSYGDIREFITLMRDDVPVGVGIGDPTATTDPGVVINGVRWATRNVDAPGTFAATPESHGMLYKWNSKKAYPSAGLIENWDTGSSEANTWHPANDPCPDGWRLPLMTEIDKLSWTKCRQENGKLMGVLVGNASKQIFLPYVQARQHTDGVLYWPKVRNGTKGVDEPLIFLPIAKWSGNVGGNIYLQFQVINKYLGVGKGYTLWPEWKITNQFTSGAYPCRCVKD
jgi:hypothetical protein